MVFLAVTGLTGLAIAAAAPAFAVAGTVAGQVFEDYNANGMQDPGSNAPSNASATDAGVPGATISITDSTGASVGTGTSGADGSFSISVTTAATDAVRVVITPPTGYAAGPHGTDSDSTVQFVTLGTADAGTVDVGLSRPGDYSQPNPRILDVEQYAAISAGTTSLTDLSTKPSVVSSNYSDRGGSPTTTEATMDQTGTVWGLAQLGTRFAFSAATLRRHAPVGPGGLGQIYLTDLTGAPNASQWVTIPDAGTNPRTNESSYTYDQWFHDVSAFPQVDKVGLGGMALAPDGSALYVVNLNDKSLYRVPLSVDGSGTPMPGTPVSVGMPTDLPGAATGCGPDFVRPFGVTAQDGAVWVTLTCTGPMAGDLRGYVYRYDVQGGSFGSSPAFEMALSGYSRGNALNSAGCPTACSATWNQWPVNDTTFPATGGIHPEPLLSDLAFDANGDMTIGVTDRFASQVGYEAGNLNPGDNTTYEGFSAGDILRACGNPQTGWTLEHNASCGTRTGADVGNAEGPGGGEFYDDNHTTAHDQIALGGLLQLPGYGQVVDTAFDAGDDIRTAGLRFSDNTNGAADDFHDLVARVNPDGTGVLGSFSKAGGLGDVAALVEAAPVEIGNRVWQDLNYNGVQDAGEPAVAGVTVNLYAPDGTTPLASAVTDSSGNYYFSSATGTSSTSSIYNLDTLQPDTSYQVRLDNTANFTAGGPLNGYEPTTTAAGSDTTIDSNGATVAGVDQAAVITGAAGVDDHTIDFGFAPQTYAVGDFVWIDTNKNGIHDTGEPGIPGVTVTLLNGDGSPAHHPDGSLVAAVQTDSAGHYAFDFLAAGSYRASFTTLPAGYTLTTQSATDSTEANDSNPATSTGLTPTFAVGPLPAANMRAVVPGDGVTRAVAINPTIDAGLVVSASVLVGDFVWNDTNHNGIQDTGEPGINGVTVTITGPGGPVTDIFGQPVLPVTTSGNGGYLFSNLPLLAAGESYTTHIDDSQAALTGYTPTTTGQGTPSTDSSTSQASSGDLTTGGSSDLTLDFGFVTPLPPVIVPPVTVPSVSVGDFVWVDTNHDGVQDSGEPGIGGVRVTLTGPGGGAVTDVVGNAVAAVTTDSAGKYLFSNLPVLTAGQSYTTHVDNSQTALSGYVPTLTGKGTRDTDSSTGQASSGDLTTGGASDLTLDFGFVKPVSVGDFVWVDTNHNGVQDAGEPGIPDVVVTLTDAAGNPVTDLNGTPVGPQTTGSQGEYAFTNLPPGQYAVHVDSSQPALAKYSPTDAGQGDDRAKDSSTDSATSRTLAGGESDQTLDFGFVSTDEDSGSGSGTGSNGSGTGSNGSGTGSAGGGTTPGGQGTEGLAATGTPVQELVLLALAVLSAGIGLNVASSLRRRRGYVGTRRRPAGPGAFARRSIGSADRASGRNPVLNA